MRVVHLNRAVAPASRTAEATLTAWPALTAMANAAARAGADVSVLQAAEFDATLIHEGVPYHFARVGAAGQAQTLATHTCALQPDVVHVLGIASHRYAAAIAAAMPGVPVVMQDRADRVPRFWRRHALQRGLRGVTGVFFTSLAQARPFLDAGLLPAACTVFPIPSNTSLFEPQTMLAARAATGLYGTPCILWIGRLAAVKDPITALRAFRIVLDTLPGARLWMCYPDAPLLSEVREFVAQDARLRDAVMLLGSVHHDRIADLLSAADIYFAASRSEGGSFAFVEALSCGVPAVVTDIPAFRALAHTASGALFQPGGAAAAAAALLDVARRPRNAEEVRTHFEKEASLDAVGRRLVDAYNNVIHRHGLRRVVMIVPGGVDASGTVFVIPSLLALIGRLARAVDLHVIALRQQSAVSSYVLHGATIHCVSGAAALRRITRLHAQKPLLAIHAVWMHPSGTLAAVAARLLRVPVQLHINGGDLTAVPVIGFGGRLSATGRARLRIAVAGAAQITVPSEMMRREAADIGIQARRVTYGVARDEWPAAAPRSRGNDAIRLLHVGYPNAVKDQGTLLRAAAVLAQQGAAFHLDVIGGGRNDEHWYRMRDELGLHEHVTLHGFVPHHELRRFFDTAHVLLITSLYEGDPVVALEAAIAGVAVVGTPVGHLLEWSPLAARTFPFGDDHALALIVMHLIADDELRIALARNAQAHAIAHDADAAAAQVLDLYALAAAQ